MDTNKKFIKQAVNQARISLQKGGFPAGAILVKDNKVIAKSGSFGSIVNDPTGHSETTCIRKACKKLKTTNLKDCVLYASLQPCLMCFSTASWAGVSKIVYGCKKGDEMARMGCYEGMNDLEIINKQNNRQIELEYIGDFENENLGMVAEWEKAIKEKIKSL